MGGADPRQAEYSLALAQCIDHAPLRSALEHQGLKSLMDNGETRRRLGELLDLRAKTPVSPPGPSDCKP